MTAVVCLVYMAVPIVEPQPPCWPDADDYAFWVLNNRRSRSLAAKNFCVDCKPVYQAEMIAAGTCIHPETTFRVKVTRWRGHEDRTWVGMRPEPPV